jgi:hypothetical protein
MIRISTGNFFQKKRVFIIKKVSGERFRKYRRSDAVIRVQAVRCCDPEYRQSVAVIQNTGGQSL